MQHSIEERLHSGVNRIAQHALGFGGRELLIGPDPQGHGICGLLRLRRGLLAEVALLIGVKASEVIDGGIQSRGAAAGQQWFSRLPQLLPALTPWDAIAFRRTNNQLPRLKKERSPEQADANQRFDEAAQATAGFSPTGRSGGVRHREWFDLQRGNAQRRLAGIQQSRRSAAAERASG